jgi:hypothetical protein
MPVSRSYPESEPADYAISLHAIQDSVPLPGRANTAKSGQLAKERLALPFRLIRELFHTLDDELLEARIRNGLKHS